MSPWKHVFGLQNINPARVADSYGAFFRMTYALPLSLRLQCSLPHPHHTYNFMAYRAPPGRAHHSHFPWSRSHCNTGPWERGLTLVQGFSYQTHTYLCVFVSFFGNRALMHDWMWVYSGTTMSWFFDLLRFVAPIYERHCCAGRRVETIRSQIEGIIRSCGFSISRPGSDSGGTRSITEWRSRDVYAPISRLGCFGTVRLRISFPPFGSRHCGCM